jgi:hypothetical protein
MRRFFDLQRTRRANCPQTRFNVHHWTLLRNKQDQPPGFLTEDDKRADISASTFSEAEFFPLLVYGTREVAGPVPAAGESGAGWLR